MLSMKGTAALLTAAVVFAGGQALWRGAVRSAGESALEAQSGAASGRQSSLPPIADAALRAEVAAATTSTDLEQVLTRHAAQAELIVPRIEAVAVAEIRRDGPRDRFVIPGLEPDEGPANSVTLMAKSDTMTLVKEFPGDVATARFSDGSVHRFVGRFPFGDVVTLVGDGDKEHRLTFVVLDEIGMVYLRGLGRAVDEGQKQATIQLGPAR